MFLIRALELARKYKRQFEEVLNTRTKYLQNIEKNETNHSFLIFMANVSSQLNQVR